MKKKMEPQKKSQVLKHIESKGREMRLSSTHLFYWEAGGTQWFHWKKTGKWAAAKIE